MTRGPALCRSNLIMFNFSKKDQFEFGMISPKDDPGIEEVDLRSSGRRDFMLESMRLIRDVVLIILFFILFGVFVAQPVVVEGSSMMPHLKAGERLIVNKLVYYQIKSYRWGHFERGDVVVFWYPNNPGKSYVKRVIGLPGETIDIRNGRILIDGKVLEEPYLDPNYNQHPRNVRNLPKKIEPHHYFVMGDNRDDSSDSRDWGVVPEKYIYGKVFFRYWHPSNIGFIEQWEYETDVEGDAEDDRAKTSAANSNTEMTNRGQ